MNLPVGALTAAMAVALVGAWCRPATARMRVARWRCAEYERRRFTAVAATPARSDRRRCRRVVPASGTQLTRRQFADSRDRRGGRRDAGPSTSVPRCRPCAQTWPRPRRRARRGDARSVDSGRRGRPGDPCVRRCRWLAGGTARACRRRAAGACRRARRATCRDRPGAPLGAGADRGPARRGGVPHRLRTGDPSRAVDAGRPRLPRGRRRAQRARTVVDVRADQELVVTSVVASVSGALTVVAILVLAGVARRPPSRRVAAHRASSFPTIDDRQSVARDHARRCGRRGDGGRRASSGGRRRWWRVRARAPPPTHGRGRDTA